MLLRAYERALRDLQIHRSAQGQYRYVLRARQLLGDCLSRGLDIRLIKPEDTQAWQRRMPQDPSGQWLTYAAGRQFMLWLATEFPLAADPEAYLLPPERRVPPAQVRGTGQEIIGALPPRYAVALALYLHCGVPYTALQSVTWADLHRGCVHVPERGLVTLSGAARRALHALRASKRSHHLPGARVLPQTSFKAFQKRIQTLLQAAESSAAPQAPDLDLNTPEKPPGAPTDLRH